MSKTKSGGTPPPVMGKWKVISGTKAEKNIVYGVAVAVQFHTDDDMSGDTVTVTNRFGHTTKVVLGDAVKSFMERVPGLGEVEFILYTVSDEA